MVSYCLYTLTCQRIDHQPYIQHGATSEGQDSLPASSRQPLPALFFNYKHTCRNDPALAHPKLLLLPKYAPQQIAPDATNSSTRHQHVSSALVTAPRCPNHHKRDHVLLHGVRPHLRPPASMVRALFPSQARPDRRMLDADDPDMALPRGLPMPTVLCAEKNRPRRIPRKQRPAARFGIKNCQVPARVPSSSSSSS